MRYEETLKHQDELSASALNILKKQFSKLDIKIPDSQNTQFDKNNLLTAVLKMSDANKSSRAATKKLKAYEYWRSMETGKTTRVPSDDWVMKKLTNVDPNHVKRWCDGVMKFMTAKALDTNMIRRSTMVGIDLTLIPYYGEELKEQMLKSKPQKGTSYFDAHMTTHSIGPGYEIPLSNVRMTGNDKMDIILHENLKKIGRSGLHPSLCLLDRGFFSVACILVLRNAGQNYLMPAVMNRRIKKVVARYHQGEIGAATRFTMSSPEFGPVSFNLLVVKKDKAKKSDPIEEQYVAFATSLPCRTKEELIEILPQTYRERWIIETAFRVIKGVKGMTCSNKLHYRIFLFYFALLLYCLWKCTKYADMRRDFLAGGDDFTMDEFVESMNGLVRQILKWEKAHGDFYEK